MFSVCLRMMNEHETKREKRNKRRGGGKVQEKKRKELTIFSIARIESHLLSAVFIVKNLGPILYLLFCCD